MDMASGPTSGASERDHFIPARKIDVLDALIKHDTLAGERELEQFRQFSRLLGAIYHYEYFDQLERLRNDYFYFNPELDDHSRFDAAKVECAYGDLIETLKTVLHNANFIEVPHEEIERIASRPRRCPRQHQDIAGRLPRGPFLPPRPSTGNARNSRMVRLAQAQRRARRL